MPTQTSLQQQPRNPLLARIAKAQASIGGNIIRDGIYKFVITKMVHEQKFNGNMFIVEFKVLESQSYPDIVDEKTGKPVTANAVGTTCSYVLNLDKNIAALGNAKSFVMALVGETDEGSIDEEDFQQTLEALLSKDQPARGMAIGDETFRKPIQKGPNAGKPFTGHRWKHIEESEDQIAARRSELDKATTTTTAAA